VKNRAKTRHSAAALPTLGGKAENFFLFYVGAYFCKKQKLPAKKGFRRLLCYPIIGN